MSQLSPAVANIIVLIAALVLYGLVWWTSRNMSRFAKVLARLSPVGLVIPLVIYVAAFTAGLGAKKTASKPEPERIVQPERVIQPEPVVQAAPTVQPETVVEAADKGAPALQKAASKEGDAETEQKVDTEQKPEPSAGESSQ